MSPPGPRAFLDGNAGMPLRPEARAALEAALALPPGNPSAAHAGGRAARAVVSAAREEVAALASVRPEEVVFTSGATEANLLAVRGARAAAPERPAFVTTRAEHPALLALAERLEEEGVPVRRAGVDAAGRVRAAEVAGLCRTDTAVASVVLAQPETGALEPVARVAALLRGSGTCLHTDASQAAGRLPFRADDLGADLVTLSSQKLGGPTGVGALVVRDGARWRAPDGRTSQESGRRPGTEAVALIAAFGAAARRARADADAFAARARALLAPVADFVRAFPGGRVLSPDADVLPNTLLVAFDGCPGDALVMALDAAGVEVSTGTACTSLARTPSEVLRAGGHDPSDAARAVRISLSWSSSPGDTGVLLEALARVVPRVREALARG